MRELETEHKHLRDETDRLHHAFSQIASDLTQKLSGGLKSEKASDALQQVLDTTLALLDAEKCALFLVDVGQRSLVLERISGAVQFDKLKDVGTYSIGSYDPTRKKTGVTPWVWYTRKPFRARSFRELISNSERHWKGNWDAAMYGSSHNAENDFKCVYMVPLITGDSCLGVLKYENRTGNRDAYDEADERLIDMIGALITNLVVSQRMERNRYDKILPVISTTLISSFGQTSFYEQLLEECRRILEADFCSLFLVDGRNNLRLQAIVGKIDADTKRALEGFHYESWEKSNGLTPWILKTGKSFNSRTYPDLRASSEGHHWGKWDNIIYHDRPKDEFKSLYSIPLIVGKNKIGVLKVENKNVPPYYFTESDETLFDLIGRLIAIGTIYDTEKYFGTMVRGAELGFLAAGISHEFYNYLHRFLAIVSNAKDLCNDLCNDPSLMAKLNALSTEIRSATEVINHFQSIRNRQEANEPFNPDKLVNDVIAMCQERFRGHNVEINYRNDGVSELCMNPADFQTILINTVKNSFESIVEKRRGGSVDIIIRPDTPGYFCLKTEDDGGGISEEQKDQIFFPFFTTKLPTGMGFGLFGVKRIVEAAKGEIKVTPSNLRGGATFEFILPICPQGGES